MAEENTAEREAKADAAFSAGFGGTPPAETPPVKVVEDPVVEPATPVAVVPAVVPPKPEYIRVTKQDWDNAKASLGKLPTFESRLAKFEGSMPTTEQVVQQAIEAIRTQTPTGAKVTVTPEDFAELGENFEEVSGMTMKGLQRVLDRFNVTGTASAPDPEAINRAVDARLKARDDAAAAEVRDKELKGLNEVYPDWGKIVGQPHAMGTEKPVETDWRKWATTNDQAALTSTSAAEVQASITRFKASQTPSTPAKPSKADARRAVIEDAITPRADGSPPPLNTPMSAEEAFGSGFKAARRH